MIMVGKKLTKGFTLIELLVVISIIALLLSILMPSLQKVKSLARMSVDSSNQRQVVLAVNTYAAGWQKMPPSIQGYNHSNGSIAWTIPFRLNYHPPGTSSIEGINGGCMGRILGSYLEVPTVFQSPFIGDDLAEKKEQYLEGSTQYLNSSYFLLWNYQGWKSLGFEGPSLKNKNKLLTAGFLLWNNGVWADQRWVSCYKFDGASKSGDPVAGEWYKKFDPDQEPIQLKLNAGYFDGHVERYEFEDSRELVNRSTETYFYVPSKLY